MTNDNLVHYPVGPGDFLSLLERVGQLRYWHIRHNPMPAGALTTFTTSLGNVNLGRVPHLLYFEDRLPAVRLGDDIMFDLGRELINREVPKPVRRRRYVVASRTSLFRQSDKSPRASNLPVSTSFVSSNATES